MTNTTAIEEFEKLLQVSEQLMGPQGCQWDKEQTLESIRHTILEEACEVIEAIHLNDPYNLLEELGDLFYNVIFFAKLAEKQNMFFLKDVINVIREKLIARHPHVFGEFAQLDAESVIEQWEKLKSLEPDKINRKSAIDGIPHALPGLARAYKMISKMSKTSFLETMQKTAEFNNEDELGELLWSIIIQAKQKKLHPEIALRKLMAEQEIKFKAWESCPK